ncbi:viral A-type inclusion protein [Reticulomyxa filosa]|uniref:Viral A-type inclusion protein n=1 Tax=Reticulomyxa filosa TaxID=46433 RepID=X6NKP3_RETFI|nr:viral A-type inclusion protein [Reticulomyxa filosa]|eukprot:ETO26304.1 viral A-type inclusion protein [Reticulomyxa filosa]
MKKQILYSTDMAPAIQNNAKQLQRGLQRRKSIDDIVALGIIHDNSQAPAIQSAADSLEKEITRQQLSKSIKQRPDKLYLENNRVLVNEEVNKHEKKYVREKLQQQLGRERRPTMMDLELRGVVPEGYFSSAERAITLQHRNRQSVIDDLKLRLEQRPDYSRMLASGLLQKALEHHEAKQQLEKFASELESPEARANAKAAKSALEEKLDRERRPSYVDLQKKNILKKSFNPNVDAMANASAKAELERHALEHNLKFQLASRRDPEDMVDSGYLYYPVNDERALSPGLHGVAHELQENLKERPHEEYLIQKGIIHKDESPDDENHPRQGYPDNATEEVEEEEEERNQHAQGRQVTTTQKSSNRFAYQTKPQRSQDMPQLIHQDVHEPHLEVDVLVPEPELSDVAIKSSPLAFMNVLDSLQELNEAKIDIANKYITQMKDKATKLFETKSLFQKIEKYGLDHLDVEFKSCGDVDADLEALKNELIQLQTDLYKMDDEYRPVHSKLRQINTIGNDLEKYQDNYQSTMAQLRRVHTRINQVLLEHQTQRDSAMTALQATELQQAVMKSKISDKIAETLVNIDRLEQQLREAKEERIAAQSYATSVTGLYRSYFGTAQQEHQFEQECKSPKELELEDELNMSKNFLTGLNEFLKGLKKLRKEQRNKVAHLEQVIEQFHKQRAAVAEKIGTLESEAIEKLRTIRHQFIAPLQEQLILQDRPQNQFLLQGCFHLLFYKCFSFVLYRESNDNETKTYGGPALSLEDILKKRVNRMNQVYKKLRDLESRAMTTGSREYLRGLTEITELQVIMRNQYLKYFFTTFVTKANQMFHDLQLASIAITEKTSNQKKLNELCCTGANDPSVTNLSGVKTLVRVLERNKRSVHLAEDIEEAMRFVEAMPDREIVIMQVARHLALATPYKQFITGKHRPPSMMPSLPENDNRDLNNSYVLLELFITKLLEEWIGSVCNAFGKTIATSVRIALEDDVIAQVRPSNAARLIINCVWGLDSAL